MNRDELIKQTEALLTRIQIGERDGSQVVGAFIEAKEFFRLYAGPQSAFFKTLAEYHSFDRVNEGRAIVATTVRSFLEHLKAGLDIGLSPERQAQLDVVSDYLEMANTLLETKVVHAAAPAMIIGATLEEFLRTWIEADGLSLTGKKPSLESYSQVLREADLITKQDGKDITSWAGIRNHAAHGEWDEVADKNRIRLMLEGVNLFMRKYAPER